MMSCPLTAVGYLSRREVIDQMASRYHEASLAQKVLLLDMVVVRTGYARKYAIRLLNQKAEGQHAIQRRRLWLGGAAGSGESLEDVQIHVR